MKERLVGAAVLVALGIVLIPLLLDGRAPAPAETRVGLTLPGQESSPSTHTIEINRNAAKPAGPSRAVGQSAASGRVTRSDDSSVSAEGKPASKEGDSDSRTAPAKPAASPPKATSTSASGGSTAASAEQPVTRPAAEPAPAPAPGPAPEKVEKAPPKPESTAASTPAAGEWAVQVGSFGSRANADRLRGQLAGKGFPVFVTQIESRGRTFHRVRVGPAADRAGAEALLRRLGSSAPGGKVVRNLP